MQHNTKKIAIFVEGYTEFHLVERLLQEFCGYGRIRLECYKKHGPTVMLLRSSGAPEDSTEVLVQLTNFTSIQNFAGLSFLVSINQYWKLSFPK